MNRVEQEDMKFEKIAVIDGRDMNDEMMFLDENENPSFPHYRKDAETDPFTRNKIAVLEKNVFYIQTPVIFS